MKLRILHESSDSINLKDHSHDNLINDIKDQYKITDKKKSMQMKNHWKTHRKEMQKSINDWHDSVEGKMFHRKLNRFNALH